MLLSLAASTAQITATGPIEFWMTNPDRSALFQRQAVRLDFGPATNGLRIIEVDPSRTYQTIDGFGFTLTGGSAQHIVHMDAQARASLLRELFGVDGTNIGVSFLRISIGASDLNERVFSYDGLPAGEEDPEMRRFDLGPDRVDVIPVLKEIFSINPEVKIMGSPWSAPTWMKDNGDTRGGSLKRDCYGAYARYFVRYIQEMKREGIRIDSVTVQNEPLHPGNNPSMLMLAPDQADFVKNHLGPAFKSAGIDSKIIIYDHNCDRPDYPLTILNDPAAKHYVDGSAFHMYAGRIDALRQVHEAHPDRNVYFTEQWIGAPGNLKGDLAWHTRTLIIGATRNWSRTVLEWNLASDPKFQPHTDRGGCTTCLGAVTIDGNLITRNPAYYIIAHASRFVRPGSRRIESNSFEELPNVAFLTTEGKRVLIVLNNTLNGAGFGIRESGKTAQSELPAGAVGTYVWQDR
jgi:glucosylceramidase